MQYNNSVDANQKEIVAGLRAEGCQVELMQGVKGGFPDLLVTREDAPGWLPMEVKDGSKPPSQRKLTPAQIEWHKKAQGPVALVTDLAGALTAFKAFVEMKKTNASILCDKTTT